jgi:uroporphyrinogen-III synthase
MNRKLDLLCHSKKVWHMPPTALEGKRIVITRPPHQAEELGAALRAFGSEPVAYPCTEIAPPEDTSKLDGALRDAASGYYHWLVLTNASAVVILKQRTEASGISLPRYLKIAAVGPATVQAAWTLMGLDVRALPEKFASETLVRAIEPERGTRILMPQAEHSRNVLAQHLIGAGAAVMAVDTYRTIRGSGGADVPSMLTHKQIDAVTFGNEISFQYFMQRLSGEGGSPSALKGVCIACTGAMTAEAAEEAGLSVDVLPEQNTTEGLVNGLLDYFATKL